MPAKIRPDLAPDQSKYNAADGRLRDAAGKLQLALNAEDVKVGTPMVPVNLVPAEEPTSGT